MAGFGIQTNKHKTQEENEMAKSSGGGSRKTGLRPVRFINGVAHVGGKKLTWGNGVGTDIPKDTDWLALRKERRG